MPVPEEPRYKAGPGIPEYLVGKSMSEGAALTAQLYNQLISSGPPLPSLGGGGTTGAPATRLPPGAPDPDEFIHDPAGATQRLLNRVRQTELVPEFQARDNVIGQQAMALAQLQFPNEFKRWGPEIAMMVDQIPGAQRTPQAVGLAVDVIRSRHLDELVAEQANAKIKNLVEGGQLRPQGADGATGAGVHNRVDFEQLPPGYRAHLNRLGVTYSDVDEVLRKAYPDLPLNKAREKWMKSAMRGDVITDASGHLESIPGENNNG